MLQPSQSQDDQSNTSTSVVRVPEECSVNHVCYWMMGNRLTVEITVCRNRGFMLAIMCIYSYWVHAGIYLRDL